MKLVDLVPLQEIDFKNQDQFDKYNKQHKLRPDTKVTIAGNVTTAGKAAQVSQSPKGASVFGSDRPISVFDTPKKSNGGGTSVFDQEPLKTKDFGGPGSLSKALYGDPNKEPDVVAKPVGNADLSKFPYADKNWFTKGHAVIGTMYDDNLTIVDLQNLFKAKGYGDVTDKTLAGMVADYNDDEDMQDRFKDRGMNKRKFLARIKDLNSQLQSSSTQLKSLLPKS